MRYNRSFSQIHYNYKNTLEHLNFHRLCSSRRHLNALFLVNVYSEFKFCFYLLETLDIRAPSRRFKDFPFFAVGSSRKNFPSARRASVCVKMSTYFEIVWLCLTIF
jgi:hypothetical protein